MTPNFKNNVANRRMDLRSSCCAKLTRNTQDLKLACKLMSNLQYTYKKYNQYNQYI